LKTRIQILSNTNFALSNVLKSELLSSKKVSFAVAFLKKSGIEQIIDALDFALTKNQAQIEFIVGLDFKTTDIQALNTLQELKNKYKGFKYYCFGDKRDNHNDLIFHPKIYLFDSQSDKNPKFTSIVGSSNLTGGGLSTNFEVNTIFSETKPIYYTQLIAIYNEIKFTDSIFVPNKEYLEKYADIKKDIEKIDVNNDKLILEKVLILKKEENELPGTLPSMKNLLIRTLLTFNNEDLLKTTYIYEEVKKLVEKEKLIYKMDTFDNSLRGELVKHEESYQQYADNQKLFRRIGYGKYTLTENGFNYKGR
jgi:HKD family nuclease